MHGERKKFTGFLQHTGIPVYTENILEFQNVGKYTGKILEFYLPYWKSMQYTGKARVIYYSQIISRGAHHDEYGAPRLKKNLKSGRQDP